ncbi:MAG: ATP-binding protein [Acidimicrobiia bacterium]|nr:ATP-binding protein [Acidimicrobiia bacterium]
MTTTAPPATAPPEAVASPVSQSVTEPATQPVESTLNAGSGQLSASLEHLRRRSTIRTQAVPDVPQAPPAPPPVAAGPGPAAPPTPAPEEDSDLRKPSRRERRKDRADRRSAENADGRLAKRARRRSEAAEQSDPPRVAPAPDPVVATAEPETTGPEPPSAHAPGTRKEHRRARKAAIADAKQEVATQKRAGKRLVAATKRRSKTKDYLATKIPTGDWSRRKFRAHVKNARQEARSELVAVRAEEKTKLVDAKAALTAARQRGSSAVGGRAHLIDARVWSIRLGLVASWAGLGAMAFVAWEAGNLGQDDYWIPVAAGAAAVSIFTFTPWRTLGWRPVSSLLVFLWLAVLVGVMVASAPFHESTLSMFIASVWIVVYAAVLLPITGYAAATALVVAAFGFATSIGMAQVSQVELGLFVTGLAMTALIAGITVHELRSQAMRTAARLTELDEQSEALVRRESEILQLYEVSRTIGAGENIEEVLPELVARTAGFIGAKVGLVILHKPLEEQLVALSPLWVAGQALQAEGYRFDVGGESTAGIVFESGAVHVRNELSEEDIARDQLLADLGVERVAAVPLLVEGVTIGVLLVADKADDFTEADISALELLSTPAGLVLNHLARYEEAQDTGRRMSELAQLKSDFVSVVSHELRTPLTSVIGALSTLTRPELAPDNPVAMSLLDSASNQAKRLKTLIEDLLTVSKIDNEALPIRVSPTDLGQVLSRIVSTVSAWTEHVTLDLPPNLPQLALDPDHFERVITNLLDNARKYASDSPIEITARAVDEEVWVAVVDHGEGIPFEYESTIFERFTQIERPDTRFKGGTGLGLNIAKDLTEAMHGRVWLEQTPEGGATFTLAFPRAEQDEESRTEVGRGMLLVDPSRDRVEAPVNVDDLTGSGDSPVAE